MSAPVPAPRRYPLLVFDWDGTLVDSVGSIVACMHATTDELGLPRIPDATIRETIGLGLQDTLQALLPEADPDLRVRVVECYRDHWLGSWADRHAMIVGAQEVLERLRGAGYGLAIATGKSRRGLERDLDRFGIRELFRATRTVDEVPAGKPSPRMVEEILVELGVGSDEALVVGDTSHDLRMASGAGVAAVAVASGSGDRWVLETLEPLALLPDVTHLPGWLEGD